METRLVIDGYNVLFQTPLMVAKRGQNDYQLSRARLAAFVALVVPPTLINHTLIVYDSKRQRTDEAAVEVHPSGLQIAYASNFDEADQYIEALIIGAKHPKQLEIITSDGKIKSTARSYSSKIREAKEWYLRSLVRIPVASQVWISEGTLPDGVELPDQTKEGVERLSSVRTGKFDEPDVNDLSDEELDQLMNLDG